MLLSQIYASVGLFFFALSAVVMPLVRVLSIKLSRGYISLNALL